MSYPCHSWIYINLCNGCLLVYHVSCGHDVLLFGYTYVISAYHHLKALWFPPIVILQGCHGCEVIEYTSTYVSVISAYLCLKALWFPPMEISTHYNLMWWSLFIYTNHIPELGTYILIIYLYNNALMSNIFQSNYCLRYMLFPFNFYMAFGQIFCHVQILV